MKTKINKARETINELFFEEKLITQWQWELFSEVFDEFNQRICPVCDNVLNNVSIADLSVSIDIMRDLNEQAMRDKVSASTFTESQKPLKMKYPYPETLIAKLEKEVKNRLNLIKKMK